MLKILWHTEESAGFTDLINTEWLLNEGNRNGVVHGVLGPRSGQGEAKCDIRVDGSKVDFDYTPYEDFNIKREILIGVMRVCFTSSERETVSQVLWMQKGDDKFEPCATTATLTVDECSNFDGLVAESSELTSEERCLRLATANKKPEQVKVITTVFKRNPDVVAEVLYRAAGVCGVCSLPAPFKRAGSGQPYLEVHHKVRLSDGGDDTVSNALAVCPNCHREAHYG